MHVDQHEPPCDALVLREQHGHRHGQPDVAEGQLDGGTNVLDQAGSCGARRALPILCGTPHGAEGLLQRSGVLPVQQLAERHGHCHPDDDEPQCDQRGPSNRGVRRTGVPVQQRRSAVALLRRCELVPTSSPGQVLLERYQHDAVEHEAHHEPELEHHTPHVAPPVLARHHPGEPVAAHADDDVARQPCHVASEASLRQAEADAADDVDELQGPVLPEEGVPLGVLGSTVVQDDHQDADEAAQVQVWLALVAVRPRRQQRRVVAVLAPRLAERRLRRCLHAGVPGALRCRLLRLRPLLRAPGHGRSAAHGCRREGLSLAAR
mmetsp:Transcript_88602/g.240193  ORF Transcript_88602/g.240193 Transcript_88602/m.240193 type:complete len:321 (+) Transcript_88602:806-1768(+)